MAVPALSNDILYVICEELGNQGQFDTLLNCACSSRTLAVPALTNMYRHVTHSLEDSFPIQKCVWRTIIASSLNATMFPYCRYLRVLDLRDFANLLEDQKFGSLGEEETETSMEFFRGPLKQFEKTYRAPKKTGLARFEESRDSEDSESSEDSSCRIPRLNVKDIVDAVGEVVTQHTPALETLAGGIRSRSLLRWTSRLPRLQCLDLNDGRPLQNKLTHASIYNHCPRFSSLIISGWRIWPGHDLYLSKFLSSIRPNSLKTLETNYEIDAGAATFRALNHHGKSLKYLRISVPYDSLSPLSLLQGCVALRSLYVGKSSNDFEFPVEQDDRDEDEVLFNTVAWLRKCTGLRCLSFGNLFSAPALIAPILLEDNFKLVRLEVDGPTLKDHRTFHQALAHQHASLRYLSLTSKTCEMVQDDLDVLVESLKQLRELRDLELYCPKMLRDEHLIAIIKNLSLLEALRVRGAELNNDVLLSLANLRNLRDVNLSGVSKVTLDGLIRFVLGLGPGNQGIDVRIEVGRPINILLTKENINMAQDHIAKIGGTLEYRGPWYY